MYLTILFLIFLITLVNITKLSNQIGWWSINYVVCQQESEPWEHFFIIFFFRCNLSVWISSSRTKWVKYGPCPNNGLKSRNIFSQGSQNYGIWVANSETGPHDRKYKILHIRKQKQNRKQWPVMFDMELLWKF